MSMRKKYSGSVVRANPVVPTEDSASGIWTLDQQNQNQKRGTWPFVGDPNFKDTVLLLHGDTSQTPSSESQSADNQEVRLIGDAKATNWNPFNLPEGYWSVFIDGTDDILSVPNSSNHEFGTGQFTVELWVYMLDKSASSGQGFLGNYGDGSNGWAVQLYGNNLEFAVKNGQIAQYDWSSRENNRWYHLAFARDGSNNMRAFIDGTQVVTGVKTDNITIGSNALQIGNMGPSIARRFKGGYISNVRIVKGTALYTSTFTKSTAPLTTASQGATASGVELLMCQSNSFVDNSSNAFTVTLTSTPKVETFSPFSYTPTAVENNYGSYYFDGSTTQVAYPSNVDEFTFGTEDFHYEFWLYPTGGSGAQRTLIGRDSTSDANISYIYLTSGNHFNWYLTSAINLGSSTLIYLYSWYHLVVSRKDGTLRLFVNGEQKASAANTTSMVDPVHTTIGSGGTAGTQHPFTGYIYNVIVKSKGVDSVTVPTKPTELTLTEGENSVYFDGSGDYLELTNTNFTDFDFGTGPFLIEGWIYYTTLGTTILGQTGWGNVFQRNSTSNVFQFYQADASGNSPATYWITGTTTLQTYKWYHFALQRDNSGNLDLWVNGSRDTTNTTYASTEMKFHSAKGNVTVGYWYGSASAGVNYISNLKIAKSAIYTSGASITVPTAPSPATTGVLLACASRYIEDRSPANNDITAYADAVVSGFNPFNEGYWSNYFDGSGDYFQVNSFSHTLSGQWSWECWVYKLDTGIDVICSDNSLDDFQVALTSPNINFQYGGSQRFDVSTGFNQNVWYHICITRDGSNNIRCFINGVLKAYVASMSSNPVLGVLNIGRQDNSGSTAHPTYAYLSNLRFVIGSIPTGYQTSETSTGTSIFTSPTDVLTTSSQGTTASDVKLLTCQSNRFLDNSASSHGITVSGNTSIDEFIPFELPSRQTKLLAVHNNQDVNNNSFQDSSLLKNFITKTGNVAQGTFSPFSAEDGYWSNYFDGSGDYLVFTDNAALEVGSNDFTFEVWYMPFNITSSNQTLCDFGSQGAQASILPFYQNGSSLVYYVTTAGGGWNTASGVSYGGTFVVGQWHHLALVRDGNTITPYFNGVAGTTTTISGAVNNSGANKYIGAFTIGSGVPTGYLSNFRLVNGTAVYDSNFTPPTKPLTAIANTSLLVCSSNTFVDKSTNNFSPTVNGTPRVLPYAPFAPRRSYSKEVVGGSAYFDGTGDKLTVAYGESIGAGDFTISAWVYRTSSGTYPVILDTRSSDADTKPVIYTDGATLYYYTAGGIRITGSSVINNYAWIFIRLVKESNVTKLFVNGTQVGSDYSDSNNYTPTNDWEIGSRHTDQHYWPGYISNLQVVLTALDGTSVPTAPFTSDENTRLLLNSTDGAVIDNTGKNNLETVNDAKVSPYTKKFGNGSMYFDGTGDVIKMPNDSQFTFGTGDFTIEMFVYAVKTTEQAIYDGRSGNGAYPYILIQNTSNKFIYYVSSAVKITANDTVPLNQWVHLAIARSGTTTKMFVNGTAQTETFSDSTNYLEADVVIGQNQPNGGENFEGYLDEVRVTKAARYTSTFTAPTRAFKNR